MEKREQEKYSESREKRDEELEENYKKVVNHIDDIDDENARDNLSDYMDELKEDSKTVGRHS